MAYKISVDGDKIMEVYKGAFIYNQIIDCNGGYDATIGEESVKLLGGKY